MSEKIEDPESEAESEVETDDDDEEEYDTTKKIRVKTTDKQVADESDDDAGTDDDDADPATDDDADADAGTDADDDESVAHNEESVFAKMDDIEDDEEDEDEHYLQKFNASLQQKIISDFHPELQSHNYDEIDVLCRVVRDEQGNIIDPLHKTLPFVTRYEKARILGERAKQINAGAAPFVEVDATIIDGYLIALKEYEAKRIPFIIKRPMPNGGVEYWKFDDLELLD